MHRNVSAALSLLQHLVYIGHSKTTATAAEMYLQQVKTSNQGHPTSSVLNKPHSTDRMLSKIKPEPELITTVRIYVCRWHGDWIEQSLMP